MRASITTLYYRGKLGACNYGCSYCPFRKREALKEELERDRDGLYRFLEWIKSDKGQQIKNIMFLPYGEALIFPYYGDVIAGLAGCSHVRRIGCQTNLSFSVEDFTDRFHKREALRKVRLWCSFHPSQTGMDEFLSQCKKLSQKQVAYCVGAVGDIRNIEILKRLKLSLPEGAPFWINAMDGRRREYTQGEIEAFASLDPFFPLEIKKRRSDLLKCAGGISRLFANGDGDLFSCNISRIKIGNLYTGQLLERKCASVQCSCYLAYSHRFDIRELGFSEASRIFRLQSEN